MSSRGLSLDMGKNHTGFALWLDGNLVRVHGWKYRVDAHHIGELLVKFQADLRALWVEGAPDWIAYEDVNLANHYNRQIHFGMAGVVCMEAYRLKVPVVPVFPREAKKRLTGSGRALKPEMVEAAQELYPEQEIQSDDVADAVAVGLVALDRIEEPVVG